MKVARRSILVVAVGLCGLTGAVLAEPVTTEFTYQGQLKKDGAPVNGPCDFEFSLWTAQNGGSPVGSIVFKLAEPLTNGLFTLTLNEAAEFGSEAFNGERRFLQIEVCCDPVCTDPDFATLPRQELTPSPYAMRAIAGGGDSLWTLTGTDIYYNDGNVGIGTTTPNRTLDVRGTILSQFASGDNRNLEMKKTGAESPTNVSFTLSHRSNGTEAWMFGSDGTNFTNFQSWDAANNQVRFPVHGETMVIDMANRNVGIGTTAPKTPLHIVGPSPGSPASGQIRIDGSETTGAANTGSGVRFGGHDGIILRDLGTIQALKENSTVGNTQSYMRLSTRGATGGPVERMRIDSSGNVGIGVTNPKFPLHIKGGPDVQAHTGGALVLGTFPGRNLAIDENEIMAREVDASGNSVAGGLALNREGGNVGIGNADSLVDIKGWLRMSRPVSGACTANLCVGGPLDGDACAVTEDCVQALPIMSIDGTSLIKRWSKQGAVTIGADDSLVIGDGESPDRVAAQVTMTAENTYISSDNNIFIYTDLQPRNSTETADEVWNRRRKFVFKEDGRLGIGTESPMSKLHVEDGDVFLTNFNGKPSVIGRRANGTIDEPTPVNRDDPLLELRGDGYDGTGYGGEGFIQIRASESWTTTKHGTHIRFLTTANGGTRTPEVMRINHDGNVGIGTTSPQEQLSVNEGMNIDQENSNDGPGSDGGSDLSAPALRFGSNSGEAIASKRTAGGARFGLDFYTGFQHQMRITQDGNVQLYNHRTNIPRVVTIEFDPHHSVGGGDGTIIMRNPAGTETFRLSSSWDDTGASRLFLKDSNGAPAIQLVAEDGDGGPSRIITDVLEIAGADLAEKFPVSEETKPGMVVAIDPDNPGQLHLARGAYNRRVAGVVSGANGLSVGVVLGNLPGHEDAPPIAMSGRVYVWADAASGPIVPGDLLTTSATAGHAMRATDHTRAQGAIIGKAMTPLASGKDLVLVLVSLQ